MRLHHLSMTAFGPFAGTVEVDFDDLADSGIFLLTGATGAGKTSVLDAVCFGLYGEVPGDRSAARHLRCDQAEAGLAPEVVLTVSVGTRTLRLTRSPAWRRPKKRGVGTTPQQAHVLLEEREGEGWRLLSNRMDEAGQVVGELLGMTCTQFTQVAMLPQGRFQAFLRAGSTERQAVLQRLFRTARFEDVERWLVERRAASRRAATSALEGVAAVVSRVEEASGRPRPVGDPRTGEESTTPRDLGDVGDLAASGELLTWSRDLGREACGRASDAQVRMHLTDATLSEVGTRREEALRVAEARTRALQAQELLDGWAVKSQVVSQARTRLERHARGGPVAALHRRALAASARVATLNDAWRDHRPAVLALLAPELAADPATGLDFDAEPTLDLGLSSVAVADDDVAVLLGPAADRLGARRAAATAFVPRERELTALRAGLPALRDEHAALVASAVGATAELADLPGLVGRTELALGRARVAEVELTALEVQRAAALATRSAGERHHSVLTQLEDARGRLVAAVDAAQEMREHYLHVRETRISHVASELASALASGCSCPVCGSAEHPAPARAGLDVVGRAEEDKAHHTWETAEFDRQVLGEGVAALASALAASSAAGHDRPLTEVDDQLASLDFRSLDLGRLAAELPALGRALHAARERGELLHGELVRLGAETADRAARLAADEQVVDRLDHERSELLGGAGREGLDAADVIALARGAATALAGLEEARRLLADLAAGRAADVEADASLRQAAQDAGFTDPEEALAAVVAEGERDELVALVELSAEQSAGARAVLADPWVAGCATCPAPPVADLAVAHAAAVAERDEAATALAATRGRVSRLETLGADLRLQVETWAPAHREHGVAAGLASLCEGRSGDNALKMRLSAYVLSERLRQVVAAANERLAEMSAQRYSLVHTDDRGAGEQRGGLSLLVVDDWSGVPRDPATLSGGETFVVSLALALGLADTVAHEAGGTDIDTLFIDEGFGSLDSETLEDVMDTLDGLRDGGRVVGLVSHVAELRSRVPAQLEVVKSRQGSTLRRPRVA